MFWAFTCSALLVSCARAFLLHDPTAYLLIAAAAVYMMNVGSQARGSAAAARAAIEPTECLPRERSSELVSC